MATLCWTSFAPNKSVHQPLLRWVPIFFEHGRHLWLTENCALEPSYQLPKGFRRSFFSSLRDEVSRGAKEAGRYLKSVESFTTTNSEVFHHESGTGTLIIGLIRLPVAWVLPNMVTYLNSGTLKYPGPSCIIRIGHGSHFFGGNLKGRWSEQVLEHSKGLAQPAIQPESLTFTHFPISIKGSLRQLRIEPGSSYSFLSKYKEPTKRNLSEKVVFLARPPPPWSGSTLVSVKANEGCPLQEASG